MMHLKVRSHLIRNITTTDYIDYIHFRVLRKTIVPMIFQPKFCYAANTAASAMFENENSVRIRLTDYILQDLQ